MRSWSFGHWSVYAALALVAGCGGSSGGGTGIGGGTSTAVVFTFQPAAPVAVATEAGSAAFTPASLSSNSVTLQVPSGTADFAIAYLCPAYTILGNTNQRLFVLEASVQDGAAFSLSCASGLDTVPSQTGTLSGTVDASAISGANLVMLDGGSGTSWTGEGLSGTEANLSLQAPVGNDYAVALASQETFSGGSLAMTVLAVKDLGEQPVPGVVNGGNPVTLTQADETTLQPITYENPPAGSAPLTQVTFTTQEGDLVPLQIGTNNSYPAVPAALLQGGAHYTAISLPGNVRNGAVEFLQVWNNGGGPLTVDFPPAWTYAGPQAAALAVFDFSSYTGFSGAAGVAHVGSEAWATGANSGISYQVTASAGIQGGAATLPLPDLSKLPGFPALPSSGATVTWQASINKNSAGAVGATPMNSSTQTVHNTGEFVVP